MNPLIFLLVSEGPTDYRILNEIANRISADTGRKIVIELLEPSRDETTGRYQDFGWKEVRTWCRKHGNIKNNISCNPFFALVKGQPWRNLLALRPDVCGLIIQVDSDIAHLIDDVSPLYYSVNGQSRKVFTQNAILQWLGEASQPAKLYPVASTHCTETWILATHDRAESVFNDLPTDFQFEEVNNPIDRLMTLNYSNYVDVNTGIKKLSKDVDLYQRYGRKIADNLVKVRRECAEVDQICILLEST